MRRKKIIRKVIMGKSAVLKRITDCDGTKPFLRGHTCFHRKPRADWQKLDFGDRVIRDEKDFRYECWLPVLRGEIPLKAHAHRADDILTAVRIDGIYGVNSTQIRCDGIYILVAVIPLHPLLLLGDSHMTVRLDETGSR